MNLETRVLLRSEQTGGMTAVVENTLPPNFEGPPLHLHDFDEAFYVLDGEVTFLLNGETQLGRPGELVFAPRCVPHTLANHSPSPARYLLICSPAGFERYFDAIAAANLGLAAPEEAAKPYPPTVVLGPPLATVEDAP